MVRWVEVGWNPDFQLKIQFQPRNCFLLNLATATKKQNDESRKAKMCIHTIWLPCYETYNRTLRLPCKWHASMQLSCHAKRHTTIQVDIYASRHATIHIHWFIIRYSTIRKNTKNHECTTWDSINSIIPYCVQGYELIHEYTITEIMSNIIKWHIQLSHTWILTNRIWIWSPYVDS